MTSFQVFLVVGDAEPIEATALYELQVRQWAERVRALEQENAELRARREFGGVTPLSPDTRANPKMRAIAVAEAKLPAFN
jgi:hypothetical protein